MKKVLRFFSILTLLLYGFVIAGCEETFENNQVWPDANFSVEEGKTMRFREDGTFKILQFTDLHLTYGFDHNDQATLRLIKLAAMAESPDLIVFTGDQTMSPSNRRLYSRWIKHVDALGIPWAFVFGNHDAESGASKESLSKMALKNGKHTVFELGPSTIEGIGNYFIRLLPQESDETRYVLFFLDSNEHRVYDLQEDKKFWYDYIYENQIAWYEDMVLKVNDHAGSIVPSLAFFHIPLPEYHDVVDNPALIKTGSRFELPCTPYVNTGMFEKMKELGSTKGVFVGHDHINDYTYEKDGILLAYGRASGFNAYGKSDMAKGARVIVLYEETQTFETSVITTEDLGGW